MISIHEDDWGMRNIYPISARADVSADLDSAASSSTNNRDPSGFGWTDVHLIKPPVSSYGEIGLRVCDVAAALEPIMPRVRRFYATTSAAIGNAERDPMGSYEDDAWCFGFGRRCYIKVDAKDEYVAAIWFDLASKSAADIEAMKRSIMAVDQLSPSFVADYFLNAELLISDANLLDAYLNNIANI